MTRRERDGLTEIARVLHDDGATYKEIGLVLGVGESTICLWVNPKSREHSRVTSRERREREGIPPMRSVSERFWDKVERAGASQCWLWQGRTIKGYGALTIEAKHRSAHRFAYEELVGPIPDGLVLDHLCRVHACVNPAHLEAVTDAENIRRGIAPTAINARKTHCKRGHELAGENLRINGKGSRTCLACRKWRYVNERQAA